MRFVIGTLSVALAALLVQATQAQAHGDCCDKCGCDNCGVTCRLICEVKKVPKVTYCCKSEPFCAAHPCPFNQVHECEPSCDCQNDCCSNECGCELWLKDLFHCDNNHAACADDFHKKKLIKYVAQKEVRVYKWVAEKTCPRCGCCTECACGGGAVPMPNGAAPAAPPAYGPMPGGMAPGGMAPGGMMPPAPSDLAPPAPMQSKSAYMPQPAYMPQANYATQFTPAYAARPVVNNAVPAPATPAYATPAGYHVSDESSATMNDPLFQPFYNNNR